jgi:hypothetical protein
MAGQEKGADMKTRPILMSAPMVRAVLDGRKTQTRRVIKPTKNHPEIDPDGVYELHPGDIELARCPYGQPGDLLYVRESFATAGWKAETVYMADYPGDPKGMGWTPSIHMPLWASRITLEITDIRVERLQDISEGDAIAEGVGEHWICSDSMPCHSGLNYNPLSRFKDLWQSINGPESWDANPWVWAVEFRPHLMNVDKYLCEEQQK